MKKLLFLAGTRPEIIKIAPLLRALENRPPLLPLLCTSGQQDALLKDTLSAYRITPARAFTLRGDLSQRTAQCILRFDRVLKEEAPDAVLVQGDTLSAFAGALAAFHKSIPVFHIEAGLRTKTPFSPFPEELYRRAIDHLSTLHFAPTPKAAARLCAEGIAEGGVYTVGNTAIDGLWDTIDPHFSHPLLEEGKPLVLLTLHRRESVEVFTQMLAGVAKAFGKRRDHLLFFPMHPNPAVRQAAQRTLAHTPAAILAPPTDAHTFRNLLARAAFALTDSGGVSEEATALGTPTLLLREETEREEGVEAGVLHLIGRETSVIARAVTDFLDNPRKRTPSSVFGDGNAALRIADIIEQYFS